MTSLAERLTLPVKAYVDIVRHTRDGSRIVEARHEYKLADEVESAGLRVDLRTAQWRKHGSRYQRVVIEIYDAAGTPVANVECPDGGVVPPWVWLALDSLLRTGDALMTAYRITAVGCDATTTVTMDLDDEEAAVVRRLAERITETSSYGCEPTLTIVKADES